MLRHYCLAFGLLINGVNKNIINLISSTEVNNIKSLQIFICTYSTFNVNTYKYTYKMKQIIIINEWACLWSLLFKSRLQSIILLTWAGHVLLFVRSYVTFVDIWLFFVFIIDIDWQSRVCDADLLICQKSYE